MPDLLSRHLGQQGPTIINRIVDDKNEPLLELCVGRVLPLPSSAQGRTF
jgi:hypothetical protein